MITEYRKYNSKISERANRSLNKRCAVVKIQKTIIAAIIIIAVSIFVLLNSTVHAFADSQNNIPLNKYYTSIKVEKGESLWTIADKYYKNSNMSKNEYIQEIRTINHIGDEIYSGQSIIVSYYTSEFK